MFCRHREIATSRREMLKSCGAGFGAMAFMGLLADRFLASQAAADGARPPLLDPSAAGELAERATHFAPRAKRVIFLFMHGGPSQVDTFDHKPLLQRDDGKPYPGAKPRVQFAQTGNLLASPWKFRQHGDSGAWVSELFPHVAEIVDDLCFVKSLHGSNPAHGAALLKIHTGSETLVRPSMGSWVTYGLGSENQNLPGFVTISPTLGHGGVSNYSSAFLPAAHHGTPFGRTGIPASEAEFAHMHAGVPVDVQRAQLDLLGQLNREHLLRTGDDATLEGRIEAFELAFRMQAEAPWVVDTGSESPATLKLYGIDEPETEDFGRQCLLARRFSEAGVRFVQCTHSYKWDQHGDLRNLHEKNSKEVDKPIAGLIRDLKSRGMLDETLVLWGGEFGRTPAAEGGKDGRDHNPHGFTWFMAGGGVKPGFSFGATDDYGWYAVEDKVHVHDLHATILALLGIDHERLTYHHAGRDHRLTDVHGHVVREIMA